MTHHCALSLPSFLWTPLPDRHRPTPPPESSQNPKRNATCEHRNAKPGVPKKFRNPLLDTFGRLLTVHLQPAEIQQWSRRLWSRMCRSCNGPIFQSAHCDGSPWLSQLPALSKRHEADQQRPGRGNGLFSRNVPHLDGVVWFTSLSGWSSSCHHRRAIHSTCLPFRLLACWLPNIVSQR